MYLRSSWPANTLCFQSRWSCNLTAKILSATFKKPTVQQPSKTGNWQEGTQGLSGCFNICSHRVEYSRHTLWVAKVYEYSNDWFCFTEETWCLMCKQYFNWRLRFLFTIFDIILSQGKKFLLHIPAGSYQSYKYSSTQYAQVNINHSYKTEDWSVCVCVVVWQFSLSIFKATCLVLKLI